MKNKKFSSWWFSLCKKFRKYTIDFYHHFLMESSYIYNPLFRVAVFKFVVSMIIFKFTIIFKNLLPSLYFYLKSNKKLRNKIHKIVELKIKLGRKKLFFSQVYNEYVDKKRKKKVIYIDVSKFRAVDFNTGIQRVLINIVKEFKKSLKYKNCKLSFCYFPRVRPNAHLAEYDIKQNKTLRLFVPKKNDLVFFIDFDTDTIDHNKDLIHFLQSKQIKFAAIVYDLLPYTNPEWFPVNNYKRIYTKWVDVILKFDCVFTISKTVKLKLIKNFKLRYTNHIVPIKLGANFKKKRNLLKIINRPDKKNNQERKIKFLMVGTLEPRKGHLSIIKAFSILIYKYKSNVSLDIVGNLGWNYNKILGMLKQSKYSNYISFHKSVNDEKLQIFYQQSDALIAASYDEGFGLPIVEAFYNNIKVIARDIGVFREVGKNKVYYFPKNPNSHALANYFDQWIKKNSKTLPKYGKMNFTTWENTSNQILKKILKV